MKYAVRCGLLAAISLAAAQALAHHGPGAYDQARTITVTGTVTRFDFVNPHVLIYIAVRDADGRETAWSGELTSPNRLARLADGVAWRKDLLAPGDIVTLTGSPARNGAPVLLIARVEDSAGNVLTGTGR